MDAVAGAGGAAACSGCGAAQPEGASCRECFDALLAFEAERPAAFGAVHHLTVAAYSLQHPAGYRAEVLESWHALLADALDGRASVAELRQRMGRRFAGATRVREAGARPPAWWPPAWPLTVRAAFDPRVPLPSVEEYVASAQKWAAAVRATLDRARLAAASK
jgi:hypothetical protein